MATDEEFRELAEEQYIAADGITFDTKSVVFHEEVGKSGDCYGAYVQAWVWVEVPWPKED